MKHDFLNDLLNLFYPKTCLVCGESLLKNEKEICIECYNKIPKTNYHLIKDNPVEKRFWGKVDIYKGTSGFFFQKGGVVQLLLHQLKYKGNLEIGIQLGKLIGTELLDENYFSSIDYIVPVPLHPKKLAKRGYNQSKCICVGLSEVLLKPVDESVLIRLRENATQTRKSVFERFENTEDLFGLNDTEKYENKHILLVDDVLTTGSTLESCIKTIQNTKGVNISIFTLAIA